MGTSFGLKGPLSVPYGPSADGGFAYSIDLRTGMTIEMREMRRHEDGGGVGRGWRAVAGYSGGRRSGNSTWMRDAAFIIQTVIHTLENVISAAPAG